MNATVLSERLGRLPREQPEPISKTIILIWLRVIYGPDIEG